MPAIVVLPVPDHIRRRLDPRAGYGRQLHREPGVPRGLLAELAAGVCVRDEELSIRIDAGGERVGQPVQRRAQQDRVERQLAVRPLEELLGDPGEQRDGRCGQREPDGGGARGVLEAVRVAGGEEALGALELLALSVADGRGGHPGRLLHRVEVDVHGLALRVRRRERAADHAANVPALDDVPAPVESQVAEELVHETGAVPVRPVSVLRRAGRKCVAREGGDDDVVWELVRGRVPLLQK